MWYISRMQKIEILKYGIYAGVFSLMVVVPFLVPSSMLFPYITGKNFYFRIITELVFGLWVILALIDHKYLPKKSLLTTCVLGFIGVMAIADVFGADLSRSFWSNYERMEGLITLIHLGALFVVITSTFTQVVWHRLIQTSLFISVVIAIQGLVELASGIDRIDGSFGNSTYLGAYALFHVFFALYFIVHEFYSVSHKKINYWILGMYGAVAIANVYILYSTGTRSALLGLVGGLTIIAIIYAITERSHPVLRKISFGLIALIIASVITLASLNDTEFVKTRPNLDRFSSLATLNIKEYAATQGLSRFTVWSMAWEGVKEKPILGWGQDNFGYVFSKYYNPKMFEQEQWFDRTHNVFFDWLIAGGILGLLSYLSIFGSALWLIWKRNDFSSVEKGIFSGLIAAYFIHNIFVFDNITSYILIFTALSIIAVKSGEEIKIIKVPKEYLKPLIAVVAAVTLILPFIVNAAGYSTSKDLIKAITYIRTASQNEVNPDSIKYLETGISLYKNAIGRNSFGSTEVREQLVESAHSIVRSKFPEEKKNEFVGFTIEQSKKQIEENPNDARSYVFFGSFLSSIGDFAGAEQYLKKAHELSPKKQTILFLMAQNSFALEKKEEALAYYREAYELDTSFVEPKLMYILILTATGNTAEANKLLAEIPKEKLLQERFVNTYVSLDRYDLIIEILQRKAAAEPQNPQVRASLAAAYLEIGDRAKAIAALEEIIVNTPEFKDQAEFLIKEIRAGRNPIGK